MKDGQMDWERFSEMGGETFITREDGSEVSIANAVYADWEWLLRSQERHARRLMLDLPAWEA
jgi:hypothetical protein